MIDISWLLRAEYPPCFPEVNSVASRCDGHQENLITGNNGMDHDTQLGGESPDVWPMVRQWKLLPLTLQMCCTSCYLAQGAGGGKVQFQVTLHSVTASNTEQQIFPRYLIIRNPEKLGFLPEKQQQKREINRNSFLYLNGKGSLPIIQSSGKILVPGGFATWFLQFYCCVSLSCLFS